MRQAAGPKPLDHLRRLITIVTDDESPRQRRLVGRQLGGTSFDHLANPVRGFRQAVARANVTEPIGLQLADDVLPGDPADAVVVERDEPS